MYSQQVPVSFRITMASLGPQVTVDPSSDNRNTVMLVHEKDGEFALCTLIPCKQEQQPLDIVLKEGDTIHLRVHGDNPVHLVGYYIDDNEEPALGDEYDSEMMSEGESLNSDNMESEEEDSELDEYEREPGETDESDYSTSEDEAEFSDEDRKLKKDRKNKPKIRVVDSEGETVSEDEDDEDDDEEDDSEDDSAFDSEDDEEIDSDEIDSDDYSSDMDSDEMESEDDEEDEESEEESEEEEVAPKRKADTKPAANLSPKKAKTVEASPAAKKPLETPKTAKESTPVSTPTQKSKEQTPKATPTQQPQQKSKEATPQGAKKENVKPAAASPASANMASKSLQGGVTIQDVSMGEGIKAQKGRQVTISYTLDGKQANAQFIVGDMSQTLRGLDTGIIGMALGGQRKVVIPAAALQEGEGKALAGLPKNKDVTLTVKLEKVVNLK